MVRIVFFNSYFKSKSEIAALNNLFESFRRFCGLFSFEFKIESSGEIEQKEGGRICLYTEEKKEIIDDAFLNSVEEKKKTIELARCILNTLSNLNQQLKPAIDFFLKYELWKLEMLFNFCQDSNKIRAEILKECAENGLKNEIRIFDSDNRYLNFMKDYCNYIIEKISLDKSENLTSEFMTKQYRKISSDLYTKWKRTDNTMYFWLVCTVLENIKAVEYVDQMYDRYVRDLRRMEGANYELSNAYYDWGRYLEKHVDEKEVSKYAYQIRHCYKRALEYYSGNFRAKYKLVFDANNVYGARDGMIAQMQGLRKELKILENTVRINLRMLLYDYKLMYHLGVLEFKANNDSKRAVELFKEAEKLFDTTILNVWKRLDLDGYEDSQKEILNFIYAELLYNYMLEAYFQQGGANSDEYISTKKRIRELKDQLK